MMSRLAGRRVLLVDDFISTGSSALARVALLAAAGGWPAGPSVAMAKTRRWLTGWPNDIPVVPVFETPALWPGPTGWTAIAPACG